MVERSRTAYITGGASGIGLALTARLLSQHYHIFISDLTLTPALSSLLSQHNTSSNRIVHFQACNTSSWDSQLDAFRAALHAFNGRIDTVFPIAGIGERKWLPFPSESREMAADQFEKPDLGVVDVDLTGVLYTVALAVQQFRRQDAVAWGSEGQDGGDDRGQKRFRGKIGLVASVCGFYCVPSLPVYTAAKHALVGLTRSYGVLLQGEGITVNAVAPNVVRTGISDSRFYDMLEGEGLLTPMEGLMEAFDEMMKSGVSGKVFECGPKGGWKMKDGTGYEDAKSEKVCALLLERARKLHYGAS